MNHPHDEHDHAAALEELRRLERVTSPQLVAQEWSSDELELREGWNAITRLAAAAEAPFDADAFLTQTARTRAASFRRRWRFMAGGLALAASLLLLYQLLPPLPSTPERSSCEAPVVSSDADTSTGPRLAAFDPYALRWQDPLDDQLLDLHSQMRQVHWAGENSRQDSFWHDNLNAIDSELRDNTL
jgi:hypothetical protein